VEEFDRQDISNKISIPVIGFAQAGAKGFIEEEGYPKGESWNEVNFPEFDVNEDEDIYALQINGDSMEPLYRKGDVLVVSPRAKTRVGDRVVIKTTDGEVMAKEITKQNTTRVEIKSLNPDHENRKIPKSDIAWIARILWVSQ